MRNYANRKPYVAPTLVRHGEAVEHTRGGIFGGYLEYWGWTYNPFPRPGSPTAPLPTREVS